LWAALEYVERNPVRAGMVARAGDYRWSSAAAHTDGREAAGLTNLDWWRKEYEGMEWQQVLNGPEGEQGALLKRCTYAGSPFGDEAFVQAVSRRFDRHWQRGRPRLEPAAAAAATTQLALIEGNW
jgi:putative transposase